MENEMNIYTAHVIFKMQGNMSADAFAEMKDKFNSLLEQNKPDEAEDLLKSMSDSNYLK
jgi:pentatricopeptide repeat protein